MRRVRTENGSGQDPAPVGDLGSQLSRLLSGLDSLKQLQSDHKTLMKIVTDIDTRLKKVELSAAGSKQYQSDHNQLHQNMAKATGEDSSVLQTQLAAMVEKHSTAMQQSMQAQVTVLMQAVTTLQVAIEEFTNKKVDVNIGQPEQTIHVAAPDPVEKRYKVKRGQNGLIDEVVERKA